ncbi:MAG: GNAT family N-acetyltransferase [Phenylobacterium sp.]|nr:GNAT family N-acetyltransferase [Phenylobacterium sp.]
MDDAGLRADPPPGLVIRRARPDELTACADIYVRVLRDTFTWFPPDRHRSADFLTAARDEEVFVALSDGAIVGLAALYRPQTFLHSLYVTDRGRGIGRLLLRHVLASTDGRLALKCQTANVRAQAFYLREGFQCVEAGEDGGVAWLRYVHG